MGTEDLGRAFLMGGLVMLGVGGLLLTMGRVAGWPRLPGDFLIQRPGLTVYVPLGTSVLLSVLLALGVTLYRLWRR